MQYLVFAFIGGVILNIMPCVLPVLTLKAFHVVDALRAEPEKARIHGIAYGIGTILVFSIFAGVVVVIRASGKTLGWGMQFQHPEFVAALVIALYAFGLNALGVFEIAFSLKPGGTPEGIFGSIGNGMLAALMSMPCTAPFLGSAAAFAMGTDATNWQTFTLFVAIGAGLAFPFACLSFIPALIRLLPKPGGWMNDFKHLMGFTLIAAAVWLFGSLQAQLTPHAANRVMMFMVVLTVGLWGVQRFGNPVHAFQQRWVARGIACALVTSFWIQFVDLERRSPQLVANPTRFDQPAVVDGHIQWIPFDPELIESATQLGQPILLDFTADWCGACKVTEATVLNTPRIHKKLLSHQVLPMQADYTNPNETMDKWIAASGRSGIPLVMVIDREGEKHLMPIGFDIDSLEKALDAHTGT